jgi:hypothetical protein
MPQADAARVGVPGTVNIVRRCHPQFGRAELFSQGELVKAQPNGIHRTWHPAYEGTCPPADDAPGQTSSPAASLRR